MTRLFLQKTPAEDREQNDKLPYFRLVLPPEEDGGEWLDLGAFWRARSGNGYSGKLNEGVELDASGVNPYKKPEAAPAAPATAQVAAEPQPVDNAEPED